MCTCLHRGQSSVYSMPQSKKSSFSLFQYIIGDGLSWTGLCACLHVYSRCNKCNSCLHTQDVISVILVNILKM